MGPAGTGAAAGLLLMLLMLLARPPPAAARDSRKSEAGLVSEHFSQAPQKLSFYSWYGSTRLFHFRVPPDTVLLRWLLHVSQGGSSCSDVEITVHFRYGAPPVINPLGTSFPDNTLGQASFHIRALLSTMLLGNTSVNVSHPAPGDWFVVAHLPPSSQKIEVKGFVPTCAYIFQPDMMAMRVVEVSILEPDIPLTQTLFSNPSYLKIFVPEYTQELRLELQGCVSRMILGCAVRLTVGATTLPRNFQKVLTCTNLTPSCYLLLPLPPWGRWLQVTAENLAGPHMSVVFTAEAALTACRPWSVTFHHLVQNSPNQSNDTSLGQPSQGLAHWDLGRSDGAGSGPFCLLNYPVMREDMDVVSVRFQPLNGVFVLVHSGMPSIMRLRLDTGMDSGGSLTIILRANQTEITNGTLVAACVNAASPFLSFSTSLNCTTAFFQGYPMFLSASSHTANLIIPYPETDNWYLSLQLVCPESPEVCEQAVARVETTLYLTPCLNDCGPYGQCLLLRRYGYLYAGCSCKAGWRGWSCTDNSTAQTVAQQRAATLLLTLSNLMFLAPIAVSVHRSFLVEAAVYFYTMFFSTFYHACDQPGEAVLCILSYDTLQYCDFLGSGASIWVTILCMARLKTILKQQVFSTIPKEGERGWSCRRRMAVAANQQWAELSKRVKKVWKPQLFTRELFSEILDKKFSVTVTMRTLDLIDEAYGFDFYILKTPKEDLCSKFGMDLKRGMLLRLARQDPQLHPDDPERRAAIYDKYKSFVIPEAEAEWVGLTLEEAVEKQRLLEEKDPVPLFKVYVEELVQRLQEQALSKPAVVQKRASDHA